MTTLRQVEAPAVEEHRPVVVRIAGLNKLALRDLSLTVRAGDRVAIIGRTGHGKSLLFKCLLGFLTPDRGVVEIFGRPLNRRVLSEPSVGVAFQNPGLFDCLSVRQNIEAAAGGAVEQGEIARWLDAVALSDLDADSSVSQLSGGQQKRLALLRAVIRGRKLLILDEPTSGLDPSTAGRVAATLSRICEDGRTVLVVTHDYETAARLCTRWIILTPGGRLAEISVPAAASEREIVLRLRQALEMDEECAALPRAEAKPQTIFDLSAALVIQSLPLAVVSMALLGVMLVKQSSGISRIDISAHVPAVIVWAVFRELAPLVVGLLLASRVGARVAAEVAGMSYTAQIASMRVIGLSPARMLLLPFWLSATIVFPLAIVAGGFAATFAGAAATALSMTRLTIGSSRFLSLAADAFSPLLLASCVLKGILMAATVTLSAYLFGTAPMESAQAVGKGVNRAVVLGAVSILAVDLLVSWMTFPR